MKVKLFIDELKKYKGNNVFNPYSDICEIHDRFNAPDIRTKNLKVILDSLLNTEVDSIWIGRDLGHRGGRRTGLALTDEAHLDFASYTWDVELKKATKGNRVAERTAANIWNFIKLIDEKIFMWNVFPFHPYEEGKQLSNRGHTSKEREVGENILETLVSILEPNRIVAIGNDAFNCTSRMFANNEVYKIRHPSYGGDKIFAKQLCDLYGLTQKDQWVQTRLIK